MALVETSPVLLSKPRKETRWMSNFPKPQPRKVLQNQRQAQLNPFLGLGRETKAVVRRKAPRSPKPRSRRPPSLRRRDCCIWRSTVQAGKGWSASAESVVPQTVKHWGSNLRYREWESVTPVPGYTDLSCFFAVWGRGWCNLFGIPFGGSRLGGSCGSPNFCLRGKDLTNALA